MTEDPAAVSAWERLANFSVSYTNFSRTNGKEADAADVHALALNSLVNLEVAVLASAFVGAEDSTWFRLVLLLALGRTGRRPRVGTVGASGFWTKGGFGHCFALPDACPRADPCPAAAVT